MSFVLLTFIALLDIRFHRISNRSLILLLLLGLAEGRFQLEFRYLLVSSALVFLFTTISKCGFGDSKLAIIILNLYIPSTDLLLFLSFLALNSAILVVAHLIHRHHFKGDIAFAPALCGAVLALKLVSA